MLIDPRWRPVDRLDGSSPSTDCLDSVIWTRVQAMDSDMKEGENNLDTSPDPTLGSEPMEQFHGLIPEIGSKLEI